MGAELANSVQFEQQGTEAETNLTVLKMLLGGQNKSVSTKISEKKQVH